ncbi:hypothetical protein K504DRAFT_448552 [Pleomassaria siparia CBS 279.74]|uniref:Uncharacterized protein n=1 Tax=Pleomassaria siparia CBS 279.74 TaxID=1314801 RepID=A0A6G1JYZ5_9PLEO|nr:hypothetical protein K504DRAFT_448552 [Pleomassaria siparia CBS 279.74]
MSNQELYKHELPAGEHEYFEKCRRDLKWVAQLWLHFCSQNVGFDIKGYSRCDPQDVPSVRGCRVPQDVLYYLIHGNFEGSDEPDIDPRLDCREMSKSAITHLRCHAGCYAFYAVLPKILKHDDNFEKVEWELRDMRPRMVLLMVGEHYSPCTHEFLVIYTKLGSKIVLDISSWQFGFGDYIFTYEDYETRFVKTDTKHHYYAFSCQQAIEQNQHSHDQIIEQG